MANYANFKTIKGSNTFKMTELIINLDFCFEVRIQTICYTLRMAKEFHLRVNGKIYDND